MSGPPAPQPGSSARRRSGGPGGTGGLGGILAALLMVGGGLTGVVLVDREMADDATTVVVHSRPSPGFEVADRPLGTPPRVPAAGGSHRFVSRQDDGTPVAYDPCRPVHYVIRPDHAPPGGNRAVRAAFARVSYLTGLRFVYDGPTTESPEGAREPYQPDRYGDRWAPVLVTWVSSDENPDFAGDLAGQAGSVPVTVPGSPSVLVTGTVELGAAQFAEMLGQRGTHDQARAVLLHELGHLVGLDHVRDRGQLMYPTQADVRDFAAGDRAGLAALGRGACVPDL
jgi:Matrixin